MSTHRPRAVRMAAQLQSFLQTKCFTCVDDLGAGIPSTILPCCLTYAHETCLLECFTHAWRQMPKLSTLSTLSPTLGSLQQKREST